MDRQDRHHTDSERQLRAELLHRTVAHGEFPERPHRHGQHRRPHLRTVRMGQCRQRPQIYPTRRPGRGRAGLLHANHLRPHHRHLLQPVRAPAEERPHHGPPSAALLCRPLAAARLPLPLCGGEAADEGLGLHRGHQPHRPAGQSAALPVLCQHRGHEELLRDVSGLECGRPAQRD